MKTYSCDWLFFWFSIWTRTFSFFFPPTMNRSLRLYLHPQSLQRRETTNIHRNYSPSSGNISWIKSFNHLVTRGPPGIRSKNLNLISAAWILSGGNHCGRGGGRRSSICMLCCINTQCVWRDLRHTADSRVAVSTRSVPLEPVIDYSRRLGNMFPRFNAYFCAFVRMRVYVCYWPLSEPPSPPDISFTVYMDHCLTAQSILNLFVSIHLSE